jgi:predicted  nucleic acid-binding Zn-ribbon protein
MSSKFNKSQEKFIIYRQNGKCGNCGKDLAEATKIELHHVLNQKDGGAVIVENAVMLCGECHLHIHNNNFQESILIFRSEFKYANWDKNSEYKGRKKGKEVEFTKKILDEFDKQYKGANMQQDSYANHIQMLIDFQKNLQPLRQYLNDLREKYRKQIDVMENAGFMEETITPLRQKYQAFSSKINEIDRQLIQHNQEIDRHKEELYKQIATARIN